MSASMQKIIYYENILKMKEETGAPLSLSDINDCQFCCMCLQDNGPDGFPDLQKVVLTDLVDGDSLKLVDILSSIFDMEVDASNQLTTKVCGNCLNTISTLYVFKKQIHKAREILRKMKTQLDENETRKNIFTGLRLEEKENSNDDCDFSERADEMLWIADNQWPLSDPSEIGISNFSGTIKEINSNSFNSMDVNGSVNDEKVKVSEKPSAVIGNLTECELILDGSSQEMNVLNNEPDGWEFIEDATINNSIETIEDTKKSALTNPKTDNTRSICNKNFKSKQSCLTHIGATRPTVKPFECDECGISYAHKQSLSRHKQTHNRMYREENICAHCGRYFVRRDDLVRHKRTHTDERPFACEICSRRFKQKCVLKEHMYSHSDEKYFECNICNHKFFSRNGLYIHKKNHEGVKNFECIQCEKRFKTNMELKVHMKVHLRV